MPNHFQLNIEKNIYFVWEIWRAESSIDSEEARAQTAVSAPRLQSFPLIVKEGRLAYSHGSNEELNREVVCFMLWRIQL